MHDVHDHYIKLDEHLRKAPKLSGKVLHPGKFMQNVKIALSIFRETTIAAIKSYFPSYQDGASFLHLFHVWWTISNSKDQFSFTNRLGSAAVTEDQKPEFLRASANWLETWSNNKIPNCERFVLSKQTSAALQRTMLCQASLIDLLSSGFEFVLTARFQNDPIERRFGQYRQMSGGRFLVGLWDVLCSKEIVKVKSLIKAGINPLDKNLKITHSDDNNYDKLLDRIQRLDFDHVTLSEESREVVAHVAGYIAKKLVKKFGECSQNICTTDGSCNTKDNNYLQILSRGGLTEPSECLVDYISDSFAYLDHAFNVIDSGEISHRQAAVFLLDNTMNYEPFLCLAHWSDGQHITPDCFQHIL